MSGFTSSAKHTVPTVAGRMPDVALALLFEATSAARTATCVIAHCEAGTSTDVLPAASEVHPPEAVHVAESPRHHSYLIAAASRQSSLDGTHVTRTWLVSP